MINIDITGTNGDYNVNISMYDFLGPNSVIINYNNEDPIIGDKESLDASYNFVMDVVSKLFYEMSK